MPAVQVEITKRKCQAYGNCVARAPQVFALGEDRKVTLLDPEGAPEEVIVRAARSCPYRVIAVSDSAGHPIFPPAPRK
jgi:ferredoxin